MRAREFVHETFNQPYSFNWQGNDAQALISRGEYLNIVFSRGIPGQYFLDFDVNGRKLVTGRGDAYRIFATVLAAIKEFVEKQDVKELQFLAKNDEEEGEGRTNLYDRLVKRYATSAGYDVTTKESGTYKKYKLLRKDLDLEGEDRWFREDVENYGGIDFDIEIERDEEEDEIDNIYVKALANGRELGHVLFTISYDSEGMVLNPQDLEVDERYRGQGIASTMYDYMQSKGYRIRRSGQQTDAGAGMWEKHKPGKNIWEQGVRVWETFDSPYKTKTEKSEYGDIDMLAKLPDGTYLSIMFNNQGDDEWQVEFYRNNSQEVTGEGDAQRIFATVLTSIQKFIKKYKPWRLTFSATKDVQPGQKSESRAKLYDRLVQRYATAWGYESYAEDHGDQIEYELTQLKQDVEENFADGKVKGKSRPGRVKRAGASCKGSVTSLRAKAKKYSGERGKMYHWCANMKSGSNKK